VIVPTLNVERFLRDALDSVVAQTYRAWEIVLVDGGSADCTLAIARSYERVRPIRQRGTGLADAWNCGLEAAAGELIAFLDGDDRWEAVKLDRQVRVLQADAGVDCAITKARFVLEPGVELPAGFRPELLGSEHVASMPSALLARRAAFARIGPFDTRWAIAPDVDWFARAKDGGLRVEIVPEMLVHKRVHDRNLSTRGGATFSRELVAVLRESVERRRGAA
jgi:glycosyltransferase involved in cell wall biosynthesis